MYGSPAQSVKCSSNIGVVVAERRCPVSMLRTVAQARQVNEKQVMRIQVTWVPRGEPGSFVESMCQPVLHTEDKNSEWKL